LEEPVVAITGKGGSDKKKKRDNKEKKEKKKVLNDLFVSESAIESYWNS